jgi:hypothetical protein
VETWTDTWHLFFFFQKGSGWWNHGRWYGTWRRSVAWSCSSWLSAALNAVAISVGQERLPTRPLLVLSILYQKCRVGSRTRHRRLTISLRHHLMTLCAMNTRTSVRFTLCPSAVTWWQCLVQAARLLNPGNNNTCLNSNQLLA